jgi:hypothetical protein
LRRPGFALLGLLLVAPVLWGALRHVRAEEALALLRESCTAHERVSFEGEAAWRRQRWNRPVSIRHDAESGRTRYRWHRRWSFTASRPNPRTPDPTAWCMDFDSVAEGYRAEERTTTRFLDREARLLVLKPRREGRPTIHLTVDAETKLPLKVVTFRSDGSLYRVAAFRELDVGPQEVEQSRRRSGWRGEPIPQSEADGSVEFPILRPEYLPEGFRCIDCRVRGRVVRKISWLYSDGVTAFEISQRRTPTPAELEIEWSRPSGKRRAERATQGYLHWRALALCRGDEAKHDGILVRRREVFDHRNYVLRVGRIEVELSARTDLSAEEPIKVLQSLRVR